METNGSDHAAPLSVMDAVLKKSEAMPEGSQKVEELDFNQFAGRSITVEDMVGGMNNMGFQASAIGEAVRIINEMVSQISVANTEFWIIINGLEGMEGS
jgi:deoxyhypusine synthase